MPICKKKSVFWLRPPLINSSEIRSDLTTQLFRHLYRNFLCFRILNFFHMLTYDTLEAKNDKWYVMISCEMTWYHVIRFDVIQQLHAKFNSNTVLENFHSYHRHLRNQLQGFIFSYDNATADINLCQCTGTDSFITTFRFTLSHIEN
jgi:hypothetical protein